MNLFGVSLLILSICIILGQSKPRGHPKKCSDDSDCNPGYTCKFIEKLGFKLCAKPKHHQDHQEGGSAGHFRNAKRSRKPKLTRAAAPVTDELSPARNGAPTQGGAPPSSKTEDDYLEEPVEGGNAGADGQEPPYPQDGDPEVEEPEAGQPEDNSSTYEGEEEDYPGDADSEVPEEEGNPKGEDSEIGENGNYLLKIYKGTKPASGTSTMALVLFLLHPVNPNSNMFCNIGSRPKSSTLVLVILRPVWFSCRSLIIIH